MSRITVFDVVSHCFWTVLLKNKSRLLYVEHGTFHVTINKFLVSTMSITPGIENYNVRISVTVAFKRVFVFAISLFL